MERPPADPSKLLASWDDWERGEITPGRVLADLKTGGLRDVLDHLAGPDGAATDDGVDAGALQARWMTWERGEAAPGQVVEDLQRGGLRGVVAHLAAAVEQA
ncbi:hypothetical protein KSP35_18810 [Aquihabitans sp. G128]|uniref:hypothetical protein n=1 Tax=Aquihabitans sp. G128 TaxID=2849779 RepID=UPI001C24B27A|nr:hypothetical protein [Aquihabitans sp. G128]QXC60360.1 hypothetical protein KSP35_18810 [Aquihabitans sp. G128]